MFVFFFILLSAQPTHQQCQNLIIEAIYQCTISFSLDSSKCKFTSCYTQSPGNAQNQTNFTSCYLSCCPNFIVPTDQTRDAYSSCSDKFNSTPNLVVIIGILIGITLLLLCIILPCCKDRYCPLYKLRICFVDTFLSHSKPDLPQILDKIEQQGQYLRSNQNLIISQKIIPGAQRICLLCNFSKASCELKCGHTFHIYCLKSEKHEKLQCLSCHSKDIFPIKQFCKKCYHNYQLHPSISQTVHKYKCLTCLMQ